MQLTVNVSKQEVLQEHAGFFFVPLASRLTKSSGSSHRETSAAIGALLTRLDVGSRDTLYAMTLQWCSIAGVKAAKSGLRRLGAMTASCFVDAESAGFEARVKSTLSLLCEVVDKDKYDVVGIGITFLFFLSATKS